MDIDLESLSDDAKLSKDTVISLIIEIQEKHNQIEVKSQEKIHYLEEQLRLLRNELFGRRSEKQPGPHPDQRLLFDDKDSDQPDQVSSSETFA